MKPIHRHLFIVVAILLIAAAVRIINVSGWPASTDEGWTYWAVSDHHANVIIDKIANDRHPPLYFLMFSAWSTLAGDSRLALRYFGIISGLLTVAIAYRIGADWFGRRAGLYAALLVATLKITVYYSQEIRHYSWTLLAVCLSTLLFLRFLRKPRSNLLLLLYALSVAFTLYIQYFGALILLVHGVVGLFVWRGTARGLASPPRPSPLARRGESRRPVPPLYEVERGSGDEAKAGTLFDFPKVRLIGAYILAAILYFPWMPYLWAQRAYLSVGLAPTPTSVDSIINAGGWLFGKEQVALAVALYAFALWAIIRRRDESVRWLAQLTLALGGIGLFGIMTLANDRLGTLQPRTLVYLAPLLIIVCGFGLSLIAQGAIRNLLALALIGFALNPTVYLQPRLNSSQMAQAVAANYSPGDLIILENGWDDYAFRYELLQTLGVSADAQILPVLPYTDHELRRFNFGPKIEETINTIKPPLDTHRRVWVVNYLMGTQVIPLLDKGEWGFRRTITINTPVGKQYEGLYGDNTIRAILYEQPAPLSPEITFGDWFALRDTLVSETAKAGKALHVDLWWAAVKQPPLDYSVGIYLIGADGVVRAQHDAAPGDKPTSQWVDSSLHFDRHTLRLPPDLPPGTYQIGVQVYWFGEGKALPSSSGKTPVIIGTIKVQ
ncbi:MAG: glycosyltransferase family 39 protein [Anaerolineae bacterium]|nr:glycosyltransferase family 39 protein [Anaerolineae bacterium]